MYQLYTRQEIPLIKRVFALLVLFVNFILTQTVISRYCRYGQY